MTDPTTPDSDELDELASVILDGEATEAERARADDDDVSRRVAEFRAMSAEVATTPNLDHASRESLIAQALAAPEVDTSSPPRQASSPNPPPVTRIDGARSQRRTGPPVAKIMSIAAIVIAILAVPALLISMNRDSGVHDTAASSSGSDASYDSQAESSTQSDDRSGAPSTTFSPVGGAVGDVPTEPASVSLGSVETDGELEASVRSQLPPGATAYTNQDSTTTSISASTTTTVSIALDSALAPATPSVGACEPAIRTELSGSEYGAFGALLLQGTVEFRGVPSEVYAFETVGEPVVAVVVVEQSTCALLYVRALPN